MDVYGAPTLLPPGYTPTLGDSVAVHGKYGPYNAIPEMGSPLTVTQEGSGAAVPAAKKTTVSAIDTVNPPLSVAGYLLELDNVTIGDGMIGQTFGYTNLTGSVIDGTGSMQLYYWPTSYTTPIANLYGQAVPSGAVNMTGILSVYGGTTPEFVLMSITPATQTPEPSSLVLLGTGFAAAAMMFLRRRKAGK